MIIPVLRKPIMTEACSSIEQSCRQLHSFDYAIAETCAGSYVGSIIQTFCLV